MSVEEIKKGLAALNASEQREVTAFLYHLRHAHDVEYQSEIDARISDKEGANWVTPEEFEKRLDQH